MNKTILYWIKQRIALIKQLSFLFQPNKMAEQLIIWPSCRRSVQILELQMTILLLSTRLTDPRRRYYLQGQYYSYLT